MKPSGPVASQFHHTSLTRTSPFNCSLSAAATCNTSTA
nr:MAG TPA: hypothetical protein [Caudoviricetes sp.]